MLITDRRASASPLLSLLARALAELPAGAAMIQLREKDLPGRALYELAQAVLPLCRVHKAPLLINDRLDIARALDLEGVHLPASSFDAKSARSWLGAGKLVGVSCHSRAEVAQAKADGADYATLGPLFETPSKQQFGPPLGLSALTDASAVGLPLFGLGGITAERTDAVRQSGGYGIAAISAWMDGSAAALLGTT
jgi:thiamine-phosphate pyrophosphorylase